MIFLIVSRRECRPMESPQERMRPKSRYGTPRVLSLKISWSLATISRFCNTKNIAELHFCTRALVTTQMSSAYRQDKIIEPSDFDSIKRQVSPTSWVRPKSESSNTELIRRCQSHHDWGRPYRSFYSFQACPFEQPEPSGAFMCTGLSKSAQR